MSLAKDNPYYRMPSDYEDDIYLWAHEQAQLLRLGRFSEVDLPNVIEEIESLGREVRTQLEFHYRDLISHLLEWQEAPENRTSEIDGAILNCRFAIQEEEADSRSLRSDAKRIVADVYPGAVRLAMTATGLERHRFPFECPFSIEFLRDLDAMPVIGQGGET
ncbi:MAG: DUF29 domain-containing protein [Rhizobiaceae bacterium]|nr:DUF29 domain-containing protein [Rhizobiaceae bacterium]